MVAPRTQAGVMACYLSHPDFAERFKWTAEDPPGATVGNRLKSWMSTEGQGCYQRVSSDNLLDLTSDGDWRFVCLIVKRSAACLDTN